MNSIYLLLAFTSPIFLTVAIAMFTRKLIDKNRTAPFNIAAERRMPGHGLLSDIIDCTFRFAFYLALSLIAFLYPLATYGVAMLTNTPAPSIWVYIVIGLGMLIYSIYQVLRNMKKRIHLRLGLEAEWAVSSELNELRSKGYHVYHDIQCEGFNIDHLVVGPNGVFCVETKGRSKPLDKTKTKQFKVQVKGDLLQFPTWQDKESVPQAIRQAKWATNWLTTATGDTVSTHPVLVIPGWYIERPHKPIVPVLAHKALAYNIEKLSGSLLDQQAIKKVCYQVEQRVKRGDDLL